MQMKRRRRNSTDNCNQYWTRPHLRWRHQNSSGWGDMNGKLREDNTGREQTMGREALGEMMSENGELFVEFCAFNDLMIRVRQCVQAQGYSQGSDMDLISPDGHTKNQILM
ncbi:unnamed protein product [Heterobilharzia americana]|nr:unnamed protein product [Heterobilharzia americana]